MLNQLYADNNYIYTATTSGAIIYDLDSSQKYAYISHSDGFSSIFGNSEYLYLGTNKNGLKWLYLTCISGSTLSPYDLTTCLRDFSWDLTSSKVTYIHCDDHNLGVCTNSGIDYFKLGNQMYRSSSLIADAKKCFVTSSDIYYTVSGTSWSLNKVTNKFDWVTPDKSYVTGSGILSEGLLINDFYINEGYNNTSDTIFCATSDGLYIISGEGDNINVYYTKT